MRTTTISTALLASVIALGVLPLAAASAAGRSFDVRLDPASAQAASGRLLLFAIPAAAARGQAKDGKVTAVDTSAFKPTQVTVAAREVSMIRPGQTIAIDADALAFPGGFSQLEDGEYYLQAVLDTNHDYNYGGRGPGDITSEPVLVTLGGKAPLPTLSLRDVVPARGDGWAVPDGAPPEARAAMAAAKANTRAIDFTSPSLSAFWGRQTQVRGWVLLPPNYGTQTQLKYPTVYYTHGYGGRLEYLTGPLAGVDAAMRSGDMPPMIWVFLDESSPTGTHEFADSVNNGPWGRALTTELIPDLEKTYRMDGKPSGRFLNGHSSGGWATLWLQVAYPKVFGGTWSTSPDPSDFHDFTGPDLYAANANVYRRPDGSAWPLVRNDGEVIASFEQFARLERVLGEYGGQLASFEWVFSPRAADGRPAPMFNRDTGDVDAGVAAYWRDHYDIAHLLQAQWPSLKTDLDGKLHVYVGDADTFYLDGAAHRLKAVLDGLGADSQVHFLPGKTHFDLYAQGEDKRGLLKDIAWEMYAVARPDVARPAAAAVAR